MIRSKKIRKFLVHLALGKDLREMDDFHFRLFCHKLTQSYPFTFVRYGDGEWNAIMNVSGENCDGHPYFDDMGAALSEVVSENRNYFVGIQPLALRMMATELVEKIANGQAQYLNADIFHKASENGQIKDFFDSLKNRQVLLIGPQHLGKQQVIQVQQHVMVPDKSCWLSKDTIIKEASTLLKEVKGEKWVVLVCASMAANVIIDQLQVDFGEQHTFLDLGSMLDPYAGVASRGYHKKLLKTT